MVEAEAAILEELERLAPLGGFEAADWMDVIRRTQRAEPDMRSPRRRRRAALALVIAALLTAAVAVSPLGAEIGRSFADFSDWLRGSPGKPASSAEQGRFARGNAGAWAGFPAGTKLRRLIVTRLDGVTYTLYGFRSGDSLCLDLSAGGAARGSTLGCAPRRELRARPQPALVLGVDYPIGTLAGMHVRIGPSMYGVARASVSFGIVADNVRAVTLRSDDATRRAIVASDAFLSVAKRPRVGSRVRKITAMARDGRRIVIPFAQAPFDSTLGGAPLGALHGPAHVDRVVHGGTIGWFQRREPRGAPFPAHVPLFGQGSIVFGRLIAPDPGSRIRLGLVLERLIHSPMPGSGLKPGLYYCDVMILGHGAGSGCDRGGVGWWFRRGPFSFSSTTFGGGAQYTILSGVASDAVTQMRLFLSTGEVVDVPLKDNLYVMQAARTKFPIRLVAYDDHGRVIGIQASRSDMGPTGAAQQPAKNGRWRILARVTRADGRVVAFWAVPSQAGGWCWKIKEPSGGEEDGCAPPSRQLRKTIRLYITPGQKASLKAILLAQVGPDVTHVEIRYRSGASEQAIQIAGFVFYAPSRSRILARDFISTIDAYNAGGERVAHTTIARTP